jgi:CDP-diacylglycerol--serine O-phosphatidyltransferase
LVVGGLAAFLTTEPWATLIAIDALYLVSFPLSIRSYQRLRRAAGDVRIIPPHESGDVVPGERTTP